MTYCLRDLKESDVYTIHSWYDDPSVNSHFLESGPIEQFQAMTFWTDDNLESSKIFVESDARDLPQGVIRVYRTLNKDVLHNAYFDIIVAPDSRGQGIGSFLISQAEQWAKKTWGTTQMFLEVYEGNPAIYLYDKLGYRVCGVCPRYLKDGRNKFNMVKELVAI